MRNMGARCFLFWCCQVTGQRGARMVKILKFVIFILNHDLRMGCEIGVELLSIVWCW